MSNLPPTSTSTKCLNHSVPPVGRSIFGNTATKADFEPLGLVLGGGFPIVMGAYSVVWSGMPFYQTDTGLLPKL
jgi:hypothetical protein